MSEQHLRVQTEELWRETLREALLEWELPKVKRILTSGVALEVISESAANEIAAALGVG